jgi:hypothetical protein
MSTIQCPDCRGRGRVKEPGFDGATMVDCRACDGTGDLELTEEEATILDEFVATGRPRRVANPARWQKALARALACDLAIYQDSMSGAWLVTSQFRPDVVHTTDGHACSCEAHMLGGDPICAHRALYWHTQGMLDLEASAPVAPFAPLLAA